MLTSAESTSVARRYTCYLAVTVIRSTTAMDLQAGSVTSIPYVLRGSRLGESRKFRQTSPGAGPSESSVGCPQLLADDPEP
jgi:hypothetical protein